jgi:hypothetical protein
MTLAEIEAELAKPEPFRDFDYPTESGGRAKGGAGTPTVTAVEAAQSEIEVELEEDLVADADLAQLIKEEAPTIELLDQQKVTYLKDEGAKGGLEVAFAVIKVLTPVIIKTLKRRANKTDHGLYPTVIEELLRELCLADLGAWVWTGIKDVALTMWEPNSVPVTEASHAGTYFFEKLAAYKQKQPSLVIDLIGHSAGSIVICHLLATVAQRHAGLKMRNIVLLAPACTMTLLTEEVVSKPERYEKFRMFTMHEDYESKDVLVPGLYTRSLLFFVSGALEGDEVQPLAGLERWLRASAPDDKGKLTKAHDFFNSALTERLVLSKTQATAAPGFRCEATSHGDFDNDLATRESLQFLIAK